VRRRRPPQRQRRRVLRRHADTDAQGGAAVLVTVEHVAGRRARSRSRVPATTSRWPRATGWSGPRRRPRRAARPRRRPPPTVTVKPAT
jgi:hypothetical protein